MDNAICMPIEFNCPHCQSVLRVEDSNAGKRARCPHCNVVNRIPGERVDTNPAPEPPVSHQFFIDSVSGQTFGPVNKQELEQWVGEGRISPACVIRATGERSGQPATVYFPNIGDASISIGDESSFQDDSPTLAPIGSGLPSSGSVTTSFEQPQKPEAKPESQAYSNPYAAPNSTHEPRSIPELGITPTKADAGDIFSRAYGVFMQDFGLLVAIGGVMGLLQIINEVVVNTSVEMDGAGIALGGLTTVVINLIQIYLGVGQTRISLKLVRGQPATFSELFQGGDKFLPSLGYLLLIMIPLLFGFILLIVPGVFLVLYFWPSYTLIVENKTSVMDSFGVAAKIGEQNLLSSFVIMISSVGILILGTMLCYVGLFFAISFVSVLWATAYLMMTGEIRR